jgi:hypothetical protein
MVASAPKGTYAHAQVENRTGGRTGLKPERPSGWKKGKPGEDRDRAKAPAENRLENNGTEEIRKRAGRKARANRRRYRLRSALRYAQSGKTQTHCAIPRCQDFEKAVTNPAAKPSKTVANSPTVPDLSF